MSIVAVHEDSNTIYAFSESLFKGMNQLFARKL